MIGVLRSACPEAQSRPRTALSSSSARDSAPALRVHSYTTTVHTLPPRRTPHAPAVMATEGLVITQANEATPSIGGLFAGTRFLVSQRVPMRTNFLDRIRANGGRIVPLESQADYIIADHARKDCPPTSLSYTFIEAAIAAGALPDPNHHRAGPAPGYARTVGSTVVPPKSTRTPFTPQDDRDLWNWVQDYRNQGAHGIKGNEIYKQLEAINPRHTFQSWRDRYVKRLMVNPPPGVQVQQTPGVALMQPASSQVRPSGVDGTVEEEAQDEEDAEEEELSADVQFLIDNIDDILNIPTEDLDAVWGSLADEEASSHLSADQWKRLYEEEALPAYYAKQEKEKRAQASPVKRKARVSTPEPTVRNAPPTTPELVAMKEKAARNRQASPSVSQKRRRQTATPRSNTYGRKRAKADHSGLFVDEQPAGNGFEVPGAKPQNVIELGTDGEDENGEIPDELALPGEEIPPTSELNRAAKAQLIAEANAKNVEPELPPRPQPSGLPVEAPAAEQAGAVSPSNVESQVDASVQDEVVARNGLELTEENLANQQAAHGVRVTRASDLRENDDNLGDYAQYLQKLVAGQTAKKTAQAQTDDHAAEPDTDLESDRELSLAPAANTNGDVGQHTSSHPQAGPTSRAQEMSQSVQNLFTPASAPTQAPASNGDFDGFFIQPSSDLVNGRDQVLSSQVAVEFDPFESQDQELSTDLAQVDGKLGNGVQPVIDNRNLSGPSQQAQDEEMTDDVEIDLTLAEPEGGFDFSSQEEAQPGGLPSQHQWEPTQHPPSGQMNANAESNAALAAPDLSEDEVMEEAPAKSITPRAHAALDTQDIYATGAQQPDFSFPLPPDSDVEGSEPELPANPTKKPTSSQKDTPKPIPSSRKPPASATPRKLIPTPTHQQQEPVTPEPESVESFLARLTADGYAPASLHSAIYRTSAQLQAAEVVAMYDKLGMGAPDIPEVWSAEDDAKVGTTDAMVFKALCEKKGWEEYDLRLKFLEDWNRSA